MYCIKCHIVIKSVILAVGPKTHIFTLYFLSFYAKHILHYTFKHLPNKYVGIKIMIYDFIAASIWNCALKRHNLALKPINPEYLKTKIIPREYQL